MMELLRRARTARALRLVDSEGPGQKGLAARLGLSITGAKSRVQRARRRLKEVLPDCCDIERDRRGNAIGYTPRVNCSVAARDDFLRPFPPDPSFRAERRSP